MKQPELAWYRLRWPREVGFDRLQALSLLLTSAGTPVAVEAIGAAGVVEHRLGVLPGRAEGLAGQLRVALPGLELTPLDPRPPIDARRALELRLTTPARPLRIDHHDLVSRSLLTALAHTRKGERAVLQWQLVTCLPAARTGTSERVEAAPMSVADVLLGRKGRLDGESLSALRSKRSLPVWRCVGRVGVHAKSDARAQILVRELVAALGLADGPGVRLVARRCPPSRLDSFTRRWTVPLRLNSSELALVSCWPVSTTAELPIERSARTLAPSKLVLSTGRVVGSSTFPGCERLLALSVSDSLRHVHLLGPTGSGKSTLLLNLIVQDVAAGHGVVVIEPTGDLISRVLEEIRPERLRDVVVLDPADDERPVGLNPLAPNGRPPELVADELLGMFRTMYESWGPRTNDVIAGALLTLARTPGMTLCALPALLTDSGFRHRVVSALDDPIGLGPFWQTYESWSEGERAAAIAPTLTRVRPFILRPQLRGVLGQAVPRFDVGQVFSERKVLLVNLGKGLLGNETAALLGGLILNQLWAAALRRSSVPPEQRHPVFVFVDEAPDYLRLKTDLGDALIQARGLATSFCISHQHLAQLDPAIRSTVLANARSRVCFQLAGEDARALASGQVSADDFRELPAFHAYAQLVAEGAVQPWCSLRTLLPPPPISDPNEVRRSSRERYGTDRQIVDRELERLIAGGDFDADDIAPRRRRDRGTR